MNNMLIFMLATIGMSHILVDGSIFNPFKNWLSKAQNKVLKKCSDFLLSLMGCYQCSGFWSGLFVGLVMWLNQCDPLGCDSSWKTVGIMFCYACAGSYISMQAAVFMMWIQGDYKE